MDMMQDTEMQEGQEQVTCLMICLNPDGTATVSSKQMPPQDGEPAQNLDEAFEIARGLAENPTDDDEQEAIAQANVGYNRKAQGQMGAPNPDGIFGE